MNDVEKILDRWLEVYEVRDPRENEERYRKKRATIKWIMSELEKGPIEGGTISDLPDFTWGFGSSVWDALRESIRVLYHDKCVICSRPAREVHHIRPKHLKGKNHPRNLILLCNECHDEVHRKIDESITQVCKDSLKVLPKREQNLDEWL